jgi:gamma-glutamyltranspeptidase/glutathione hydrolase
MVASTHWLASATGMSVLERGGNAFDAAVAAGFVLQVAEPHLNGPAGEVPILLWDSADQGLHSICGQGVAPDACTLDRLTDLGIDLMPGTGLLPATVPGAFGAWLLLAQRWGTWELRDLLGYALHYATAGIPVLGKIHETIATVAEMFSTEWPTSAQAWLVDGKAPDVGATLRNPVLAHTYSRIVTEAEQKSTSREGRIRAARDIWYSGFVAERIDLFCRTTEWTDTTGRRHGGLLSADDLARWNPIVEAPLTYEYCGYTVAKTGPWGQGPVFLQQLAILKGSDLDAAEYLSVDYVHTVIESAKLAFADREAWYGDPAFADVPVDVLLSDGYNDARRALISGTASGELRPGTVNGHAFRLPRIPSVETDNAAGVGEPTVRVDGRTVGDTCHVDIVDREGNMVSATPSGGWLQSSPMIPALGFCLGTRGQMFWLEPGLPNSLRPGARPRTTLSPGIALRDGSPWLAFGSPGGDQQDQWALNYFLALVHGGLNLQQACETPMFHSAHIPSSFYPRQSRPRVVLAEDRIGEQVLGGLGSRGHILDVQGSWSLGRLSAVSKEGSTLRAGANPRGAQGYAVGR